MAADGGIFTFGGQQYCGSTGAIHLNQPIVGMAMAPDTGGYWLVAADGGVFTYGTAQFYGSTGAIHLNQPIVGMAATPDGGGYWLVAADGGVFSFGDAQFYGSGAAVPNAHVVGIASTPDGEGYWEATSNGTVLAFGDAGFFGDADRLALAAPIVGITPDPVTGGYWLVGADGGVFDFNAPFLGSAGSIPLRQPIVGMEATDDGERLLARRLRRRGLHLRRRALQRLGGRHAAQRANGRHRRLLTRLPAPPLHLRHRAAGQSRPGVPRPRATTDVRKSA